MFIERLDLVHIGTLSNGEVLPPVVLGGEGKPVGENILWTSPNKSRFNWLSFCAGNYNAWLEDNKGSKRWVITIERADIAIVKYSRDYRQLLQTYPPTENSVPIDWVSLSADYDAFWLKGPAWYRLMDELDCWDCETVLIFNKSIISSVKALPLPVPNVVQSHQIQTL